MRKIGIPEIEDIATGAALLGAGGGGDPYVGKLVAIGAVQECGPVTLLEPEEARKHLGYLPEVPPLYDEMTVREYLRFAAQLKGVENRAVPAHVDEIMELCGLTQMQRRLLSHLSKGYRQRAGLAQALCGDPEILVLDEPTVGLDPKQITEIRSLIRRLSREKTILFSSHILSEVQQLCDQVVILHQGQVKTTLTLNEENDADAVSLLVTVGAAEKNIAPRLRELDGLRRLTVQPDSHPDRTTLTLVFAAGESEPERRLFALLSRLGVPLLHLSRQNGDLEQVFLQAIADE